MKRASWIVAGLLLLAGIGALAAGGKEQAAALTFSCAPNNDLFVALKQYKYPRFDSPSAAIYAALEGSSVLLLADKYPNQTVYLDSADFELIRKKSLRAFIEYPSSLPGLELAMPRVASWQRVVVASDRFGEALPEFRLLAMHECHYLPVVGTSVQPDLLLARVAGYDRAVYGLSEQGIFPILFEEPDQNLIVATTKLSGFVTGRYAPLADWELVWNNILAELKPTFPPRVTVTPVVAAAFGPGEKLPGDFERKTLVEAAQWFTHSHLLVSPSEWETVVTMLKEGKEIITPATPKETEGDGTMGMMEGYSSGIDSDGMQMRRLPLRADCHCESAMVLALEGKNKAVAKHLLDFVYYSSGMCAGARHEPTNSAYGLIGWGDVAPAWLVANYGDDNARAMLATLMAGAAMKSRDWDLPVMTALLANYRTTGKLGFREDRVDIPALEASGWQHFHDAETVNYSPHFESYLWACNLWGYRETGFHPFLEKTRNAISMTMKVYPGGWRWQNNLERARMLLCLAWLVRVEDTPEHRAWLNQVADDLLKDQQPCGAIRESLGPGGAGGFQTPQSNEAYGTGETPLLQENGDPVSDQLYTSGFALLGLHEAFGATGNKKFQIAEDKLAEFLCRTQTRSAKFSWLNGTWFRAFDYQRWEAWASSADIGWGAWSLESGWGQAWTAGVLGLRVRKTTLWEFTAHSDARLHFNSVKREMGIEE